MNAPNSLFHNAPISWEESASAESSTLPSVRLSVCLSVSPLQQLPEHSDPESKQAISDRKDDVNYDLRLDFDASIGQKYAQASQKYAYRQSSLFPPANIITRPFLPSPPLPSPPLPFHRGIF